MKNSICNVKLYPSLQINTGPTTDCSCSHDEIHTVPWPGTPLNYLLTVREHEMWSGLPGLPPDVKQRLTSSVSQRVVAGRRRRRRLLPTAVLLKSRSVNVQEEKTCSFVLLWPQRADCLAQWCALYGHVRWSISRSYLTALDVSLRAQESPGCRGVV